MSTHRTFGRLMSAATLGLGSLAACAGAASPPPGADDGWIQGVSDAGDGSASPSAEEAKRVEADRDKDKGDKSAPGNNTPPRCPYGELSDPHRGFIRCLTPDERDAGWLPPPAQKPVDPPKADAPKDTPATDPSAAPSAPPAPPAAAPLVELGAPKFDNGEVPKAEKSLNGVVNELGKCIADHGGLTAPTGTLKVQFLVRARGRAEGVEVLSAKGVSAEAAACVRLLLKNKSVGAPTADPVGVTFTITLKPPVK